MCGVCVCGRGWGVGVGVCEGVVLLLLELREPPKCIFVFIGNNGLIQKMDFTRPIDLIWANNERSHTGPFQLKSRDESIGK